MAKSNKSPIKQWNEVMTFRIVSIILIILSANYKITFCAEKQKITADDFVINYKQYADYNGIPLRSFIEAHLKAKPLNTHNPYWERVDNSIIEAYEEIITKYPKSVITPFVTYLLASCYPCYYWQKDLDPKGIGIQKELELYRTIITKYPEAIVPDLPYQQLGFDSREPFNVNLKVAALAYEHLAEIYEYTGKFKEALEAYEGLANKYSHDKLEIGAQGNEFSYMRMIEIYNNGLPGRTYDYPFKNTNRTKILCQSILAFPNNKISLDNWGYFVELHPCVLLILGNIEKAEKNFKKAILYYERVILEFPKARWDIHAGIYGLYYLDAFNGLFTILADPEQCINKCREIQNISKNKEIKTYCQFRIAQYYDKSLHNEKQAALEYKKLFENFNFDQELIFNYPEDNTEYFNSWRKKLGLDK